MAATITGVVFNDLNHNGLFDPGEPGIPNVFVVLFNSTGGTCASVLTNASGVYSLTVAAAGAYTVYEPVANPGAACPPVTFTQPAGFTMSNGPRKITLTVTAAQISGNAVIASQNFSHDTVNNPLSCTTNLIQFSGRPSVWFNINVVTGETAVQGTVIPPVDINAIGYNTLDNYIYGYDQLNNAIVRVDNSGNVSALSPLPTGFPADAYTTGTFDLSGFLYLFVNNETRFYVIDLRPNSSTYMKLVNPANGFQEQTSNFGVALSRALNVSDWVFRSQDSNLYGITPQGTVQRIVPTTGNVVNVTTTPSNTGPFGAIALDATGTIYAISNSNGIIFRYTIVGNTATAAAFSSTTTTSFNDATICPNTTVAIDFGDAPDTSAGNGPNDYSTLLANNGPRHQLVNVLFLGTQATAETDAYQNPTATGDDISKGIQDDGVVVPLPPLAINASTYELNVTVTNLTGRSANLYGWVDFNGDGIFQGNEAAPVAVVPSQGGTQAATLQFTVPAGTALTPGQTFVRLRLTTDTLIDQNSTSLAGSVSVVPASSLEDTRSLGPASDGEVEDYFLQIALPAILAFSKTASQSSVEPGDTIPYIFIVSNPGNTTLTNVVIQDSLLGLIDIISSLDPGTQFTITAIYTVPADTPAGTIITNVATAASDQTPPVSDSEQVAVLPRFSLAISKTPDRISVAPGETVNYAITVTNTSNAPITDVIVKDDLVGFTQAIPVLNPGESQTFTASFTVPPGTLAGTVFTNQTVATSNETGPASDTASIIVTPIPQIVIFKSVSPQIAAPGETVIYTITATNAGNEPLTNVHITDPIVGVDETFAALNPGDSVIISTPFEVPITAMQGDSLVNVATVTSTQSGPSEANAVVTVISNPSISLSKSVSPAQGIVGSTVIYTFIVTNTGNTPLTAVQLADPRIGLNQSIGALAVGESRTVEFPFVIPSSAENPIPNTATVTGTSGSQTVQDDDSAALIVLLPSFTVTKTVDQALVNPGDTVLFTIRVSNTGSIPLTDLAIVDPLLSLNTIIPLLDPGATVIETVPFVVPLNAAAGSAIANVVTATPAETGPQQGATTIIVNEVPAITLAKTANAANALPGETITYTLTVSNTGNVDLTNVTVTDPLLGFSTVIPSLAVSQSLTFAPPFTVPLGTPVGTLITNVSTAVSDQTEPADAAASVLIDPLTPALTVVKTPSSLTAAPGDTITYSIAVTNTGAVPLTNVFLSDPSLGISQDIGTLDIGQSQFVTILFTIPPGTLNGSVIVNTAVVTTDQTNPSEGSSTVVVDPSPGLQIAKILDPVHAVPGQTVTATITVQNTGNIDLTDVLITDATLDYSSVIPFLSAGAIVSAVIPFTVPAVAAGTVLTNTAAASSDETGETTSTAAITVLPGSPELTMVKSVDRTEALPGDVVTFTFEIRNSSNSPLTNLHFVDDLLGIDKTVEFVPTGFFIRLSRTFTIPADARGGTTILNTAVLNTAQTEPITATAEVAIPADPKLSISKTVFPATAFPGEIVFFNLIGVNTGNIRLTNIQYSDPFLGFNGTVASQDVGAVQFLIVPYTVPLTAMPGDLIHNTVTVSSSQIGQQSAAATVRVVEPPLVITKSADAQVFVGDIVRFSLTVTNRSQVIATNVVLTDVLQKGTVFVANSVKVDNKADPGADPNTGLNIGSIAPGQSVVVSFSATQAIELSSRQIRNQASATFRLQGIGPLFTVRSNIITILVEEHEE
ncbi:MULTISPECIES: SdrD B-like domain-containing protein [unclassified Paenibacillus]|uniref:DUF7507 domain-containing protein n=1 Tax=unclassified Paenibacillus TaxID=185978 RepID=UPI000955E3DE|nr:MULTISPECIES: SdrD B-like domain-containing protein [unclassified Paenibacillus]ASS65385.1 DUF11 domain-containing protein [Paenibacillus sp. RUD330]SIQ38022.1 conserved repeat domain-containing protein [Paenibacillus sp. RU4X]SIQ60209.1 conserved repeat domain-containing protein [Paenibacillus sp. RU4T]